MSNGSKLRNLLKNDGLIVAPGAYEGYSARLVEDAGFSAAYMTGNGLAAVHGKPDVNYLTLSEVTAAARVITESVDIPVIADADTGYGGLVNVARCVREFEHAGIAAIHLEDQPFPKLCPVYGKTPLVPVKEMLERIDVALNARRDKDFIIIARTDADLTSSWDEAIDRANSYRELGADVIFVNGLETIDDAKRVAKDVPGPLLYNYRGSDRGPKLTEKQIADLGFKILIYSTHGLRLMAQAYSDMLSSLRKDGNMTLWRDKMISFEKHNKLTKVDEFVKFDRSE